MALKVGELFASFGIDTSGISKGLSEAQQSLSSFGTNLTIAGAAWSATITRAVTGAVKDAINRTAEFDSQMAKVFALKQITDQGTMDTLTQKAMEMGSKTKFTATEAGKAFEYMALAGWDAEQMLAGIEPIMNLAAASGEDLGRVSDIVTDAMTAFHIDTSDTKNIEHFSDVLAATMANSNTDVSQLGEAFKYVAPLAGTLGYSIEDTAAALGLMADSGIKGSNAGTALRSMLTRMLHPTKDTKLAMDKLGVSLTDSEGKMRPLVDILQQLRLGMGSMSEEEASAAFTELFHLTDEELGQLSTAEAAEYATLLAGQRGLSGLLAIGTANEAEWNKVINAIYGAEGAAEEMRESSEQSLGGDITKLNSALDTLKITLTHLYTPTLRKITQDATKLVAAFTEADPATQDLAVKMMLLAAGVGPAMIAVGRLAKLAAGLPALLTPAGAAGMTAALGIGMIAIAAIDSDNKVGTAMENMSANIATKTAEAAASAEANMAELPGRVANLSGSIQTTMENISSTITSGLDIGAAFLNTAAASMDSITAAGTSIVTGVVNGIANGLPKLIPAAVSVAGRFLVGMIQNFPKIIASGENFIGKFVEGLQNVDWWGVATDLAGALADTMHQLMTGVQEAADNGVGIKMGQAAASLIHKLLTGIGNFAQNADVIQFMTDLGNGLIAAMGELGNFAGELIGKLFSVEGLTAAYEAGKSLVKLIFSGMMSVLTGGATFIENLIDRILISAGVIDEEARAEYHATGEAAAEAMEEGFSAGVDKDADKYHYSIAAILSAALAGTGENPDIAGLDTSLRAPLYKAMTNAVNQAKRDFETDNNTKTLGELFREALTEQFNNGLGTEYGIEIPADLGDEVWDQIAQVLLNAGDSASLMTLFKSFFSMPENPMEEATDEIEDGTAEAMTAAAEAGFAVGEARAEGEKQGYAAAMDAGGSKEGTEAMATTIAEGKGPVQEATAQVSDAAVKAAMLVMSAENGQILGGVFVQGIQDGISTSQETLVAQAQAMAQAAHNAARGQMSSGVARQIGQDYCAGLTNGLNRGSGAVAAAAYNLGLKIADSTKKAIEVGSPSRVADREIGQMFGIGLVNGLNRTLDDVRQSAGGLADAMVRPFSMGDEIGIDTGAAVFSRMEAPAAAPAAQQTGNGTGGEDVARMIVSALSRVKIVMDKQECAEILTPTIDELLGERQEAVR